MISNLIGALDEFWEVRNRPKHSLHQVPDEELVDLKTANLFYIGITITLLTVTVLFFGGGAFL